MVREMLIKDGEEEREVRYNTLNTTHTTTQSSLQHGTTHSTTQLTVQHYIQYSTQHNNSTNILYFVPSNAPLNTSYTPPDSGLWVQNPSNIHMITG